MTTTILDYAPGEKPDHDAHVSRSEPSYWKKFVPDFFDDRIVQIAINRLINGDVEDTQYGIRVAVRPDLKDNRSASGAAAYWPERKRRCLCHAFKTRKVCSHTIAAVLYREAQEDERRWQELHEVVT